MSSRSEVKARQLAGDETMAEEKSMEESEKLKELFSPDKAIRLQEKSY